MAKPVYWVLTLIMGAYLALMIFVMPQMSDKVCALPAYSLLVGEWLIAVCIMVLTQFKTLARSISNLRIGPALGSLGLILIIGAIGNLFSPYVRFDAGILYIGLGQLILMNLVLCFSIVVWQFDGWLNNLFRLRLEANEEASQESAALPETSIKTVASYLADIAQLKGKILGQGTEADEYQKQYEKWQSKNLPPEIRRLPSASKAKAADPHKPLSSATAKLRALSASGTGSLGQLQNQAIDAGDQSALRTVLDRLDTPDAETGEQEVVQVESQFSLQETSGLFKQPVDDEIDNMFNQITSTSVSATYASVSTTSSSGERSEIETCDENVVLGVKEFGRLSAEASAQVESVGTMETAGKLLIDPESVANIIKKAEAGKVTVDTSSARVVSALVGQGIESLLHNIDQNQGVAGSMLVGEDGLVIASTFASVNDRDGTGALAHGLMNSNNLAVGRLGFGKVEQMIMVSHGLEDENQKMTTIFTDVGGATLAVFLKSYLLSGLEELIEKIRVIACG